MSDTTNFDDPSESTRGKFNGDVTAQIFENDVTAAVLVNSNGTVGVDHLGNGDHADLGLTDVSCELPGQTEHISINDDEALEPGLVIRDRFEIVALAHSGGMGHVYKAIDRRRQRIASEQVHVAIKMMRRSVISGQEARLALEREAARTQLLSHPNIVNIYDFDQHDDQFYLVMEWLEGESINSLLRRTGRRPLEPQFAWRVIQGIASGLQHAHSNHVVHADVNPSNIFITDTQEIKILDFGAARYKSGLDEETENDVVWTTLSYASPEVLSGSAPIAADDIFSLGCIAYRLLSGRHPFRTNTSIKAQESGFEVAPLPGFADSLWQILRQALSYERAARPASVSAFLIDFPSANGVENHGTKKSSPLNQWLPALALGAASVLGWTWWQQQDVPDNEPETLVETASLGTVPPDGIPAPATEEMIETIEANIEPTEVLIDSTEAFSEPTEALIEPTALDLLLDNAARAMEENRLLEPVENNAREFYSEALSLDPVNLVALGGLREISDVYLQQAENARGAGETANAIAALAVAAEIDPDNPAITIVKEQLLAQANDELTNARLAAAGGDVAGAQQMLSRAEQYGVIDANEIDAVRDLLVQSDREREFRTLLKAVDEDLAAGRLTTPFEDNAFQTLNYLQNIYGMNPRVNAASERLVERLLNQVVFAIAAEQFTEAARMLDDAARLGVLELEISAARASLQRAMDDYADRALAASSVAAPPVAGSVVEADSLTPEGGLALLAAGSASPTALPVNSTSGPEQVAIADAYDTVSVSQKESTMDEPVPVADLEFEKYVAPTFPIRAKKAQLTGFVELQFNVNTDGSTSDFEIIDSEPSVTFVRSARNAVKQWQFRKRDDVIKAQVTMRFEWESD